MNFSRIKHQGQVRASWGVESLVNSRGAAQPVWEVHEDEYGRQ